MEVLILTCCMFSAAMVLIVGYWNPVQLRTKSGGLIQNYTDYRWLALSAAFGGFLGMLVIGTFMKNRGARSP